MLRFLLPTFLSAMACNAMVGADSIVVDTSGVTTVLGTTVPGPPAVNEIRMGSGQLKTGDLVTAANLVVNRTTQATAAEAVRGDDPRLSNARVANGGNAATVGGLAPAAFIQIGAMGAANGVASLDATGKIPAAQLPQGTQGPQVVGVPVGSMQMYGGATAPSGWLLCQGQAVSRTVYPDLFTVLGTTYGAGDGSMTFNLPDLRGRIPVGGGQGQGVSAGTGGTGLPTGAPLTARSLGQWGGEETHVLSIAEMPSHTHTVTGNTSTSGLNGAPMIDGSNNAAASTSNATGGGAAHNNAQPFIVVNYIVNCGTPRN